MSDVPDFMIKMSQPDQKSEFKEINSYDNLLLNEIFKPNQDESIKNDSPTNYYSEFKSEEELVKD